MTPFFKVGCVEFEGLALADSGILIATVSKQHIYQAPSKPHSRTTIACHNFSPSDFRFFQRTLIERKWWAVISSVSGQQEELRKSFIYTHAVMRMIRLYDRPTQSGTLSRTSAFGRLRNALRRSLVHHQSGQGHSRPLTWMGTCSSGACCSQFVNELTTCSHLEIQYMIRCRDGTPMRRCTSVRDYWRFSFKMMARLCLLRR